MKKFLGALMTVLFGFTCAHAGNVDTYGIGAKATALGGAFSAYADDVYAPYYNPAGLTQFDRMQFSAGLMFLAPSLKAKDYRVESITANPGTYVFGPTDISDDSDNLFPFNIGFAMPLSDRLAFGLAAYAPFGVDLKWPKDPVKNPSAFNSFEMGMDRIVATPTLAYKLNNQWSLGLGVSMGYARNYAKLWSYDLYTLGLNTIGTPVTVYEDVETNDTFNWSVNVGAMYKPVDTVSIGLTYRSRTSTDFDGDLELKDLDATEKAFLDTLVATGSGGALAGLSKTKFDVSVGGLDFPDQIQGGVRYAVNDRLSIEADLVWTNWSIVKNETLSTNDPELQVLLGGEKKVVTPRNWNDTIQVKSGIEWKIDDMWTLRGGWFYDPSPIPDSTFDVLWADADKSTYAIGLGWNLGNWFVDGVFQYTDVEKDSRIIGGESQNLNDTYGTQNPNGTYTDEVKLNATGHVLGYGLTVGYNF